MLADPLTKCPECGEASLQKLISGGAAVIIRGTTTPCGGGRRKEEFKEKLQHQKRELAKRKIEAKAKADKNPPWWRPNPKKINTDILKNPEKYINTGEE